MAILNINAENVGGALSAQAAQTAAASKALAAEGVRRVACGVG